MSAGSQGTTEKVTFIKLFKQYCKLSEKQNAFDELQQLRKQCELAYDNIEWKTISAQELKAATYLNRMLRYETLHLFGPRKEEVL